MLLTLLACSGAPVRYPPVSMHTVELEPVPEGAVSVSAGATSLAFLMNDELGGSPDLSLAVGLPKGLDLRVTGAEMTDGPKGVVTLGWSRATSKQWSGGVSLGMAASHHALAGATRADSTKATTSTTSTTSTTTTAAGEVETWDYTYWNLVPALTLRQTWQPVRWFGISTGLRYARSSVAFVEGYGASDTEVAVNYVDIGGGPFFVLGPLRLGVDAGGFTGFRDDTPAWGGFFPRVGLSFRADIGVWGPARAAATAP